MLSQQVQLALFNGAAILDVYAATKIDPWFLEQISLINNQAVEISKAGELTKVILKSSKLLGFSDNQIATLRGTSELEIRQLRYKFNLHPVYKTVDTCAGEFAALTPYYYSAYDEETEVLPRTKPAVIILGSGRYRDWETDRKSTRLNSSHRL